MTAPTATASGGARAVPFTATLASEWIKLWTLPFTRRMLLLAVALSGAAAAVFTLTTAVTEGTALADMPPIDAAGASLLGADLATIVLVILAASNVASEYTTGMIRLTLATTPRRWRTLAAKAVVLTGTALAGGGVATLVAYGVGRLVLLAQGVPALGMGDPELLRLMMGSTLMAPFYALLAVAMAFVVRNTGGAVVLVLAVMSVPALVKALPGWWRDTLLPWLPASALHSLSGSTTVDAAEYLPAGLAALVLALWAAALLAAANAALSRRDG
jgi:ABC-2 type transport system permease protein